MQNTVAPEDKKKQLNVNIRIKERKTIAMLWDHFFSFWYTERTSAKSSKPG